MKRIVLLFMIAMLSFGGNVFAAGLQNLPLGFSELSKGLAIVNYAYANLPMASVKTPEGYSQLTPNGSVQPFIAYTKNLGYTGSSQTWTAPYTGVYKLEVWGAAGADIPTGYNNGAKGGYAYGTVSLTVGDTLYIYVGEQPVSSTNTSGTNPGGWNGGGMGYTLDQWNRESGGGGGTDVRMGGTTLSNRIIVAGGGGGASTNTYQDGSWCPHVNTSGVGGGLVGGSSAQGATGGSQTAGGVKSSGSPANGSLGQGGQASGGRAGGGGGYYGGAADASDGSGGSSYIGGTQNGGTTSGVQIGHGKFTVTRLN